jgi:hypothetical protein
MSSLQLRIKWDSNLINTAHENFKSFIAVSTPPVAATVATALYSF